MPPADGTAADHPREEGLLPLGGGRPSPRSGRYSGRRASKGADKAQAFADESLKVKTAAGVRRVSVKQFCLRTVLVRRHFRFGAVQGFSVLPVCLTSSFENEDKKETVNCFADRDQSTASFSVFDY